MSNLTIPPWFPEYAIIDNEICALSSLLDSHNARYIFFKTQADEKIHYDGYNYFTGVHEVKCLPSTPVEFLKNTENTEYRIELKKYFINAWDKIIDKYGNIGEQIIKCADNKIFHTETYNQNAKWYGWFSNLNPDYFPTYINLKTKSGYDNILVLDKILSENSAYYWKCSGEYGVRIKYNEHSYKQITDGQTIENPAHIEQSSAYQFIDNNPQYKLDNTRKFYSEAICTLKKENPLFKYALSYNCNGYTFIQCEFNDKFKFWTLT